MVGFFRILFFCDNNDQQQFKKSTSFSIDLFVQNVDKNMKHSVIFSVPYPKKTWRKKLGKKYAVMSKHSSNIGTSDYFSICLFIFPSIFIYNPRSPQNTLSRLCFFCLLSIFSFIFSHKKCACVSVYVCECGNFISDFHSITKLLFYLSPSSFTHSPPR